MNLSEKIKQFPQSPGVYFFYGDKAEILYIGKATNLRSRVSSYFRGADGRGERIEAMVAQAQDVKFETTDSVLEALILESNLIKKHQPKYNVQEKDDKSFSYFAITKEEFPRVVIVRQTDLKKADSDLKKIKFEIAKTFGPYTSKKQMEVALKIIRRIFPFHSNLQKTEKGCLDFQLGRCPGPYVGAISKKDYAKNIRAIEMILNGKKKRLILDLEKQMRLAAKDGEFEKAAELRDKIFVLNHLREVALLSDFEGDLVDKHSKKIRIEAYDISNISGQAAVGSMVVFIGSEPDKNQYRKFKIKSVSGINDVAMMAEVLRRRWANDWPQPDLVLLDGGMGHLQMAEKIWRELKLESALAAVAKGVERKNVDVRLSVVSRPTDALKKVLADKNLLKKVMDEAHRFAIGYHRQRRSKEFIN